MKITLSTKDVVLINDYLNAVGRAKQIQLTLQKRLGNKFKKVMLAFGDPDKPGQFKAVRDKWMDFIMQSLNKGSGTLNVSNYQKILGHLIAEGEMCLADALKASFDSNIVQAVINGPKKAQEIYLAIRRDNPDWPKEKAARIAWDNYCKNINPDYEGCSEDIEEKLLAPEMDDTQPVTAESINFFKFVKPIKANYKTGSPYGLITPSFVMKFKGGTNIYLPKNHDAFISFLNNKQPKTIAELRRLESLFARSRTMATAEFTIDVSLEKAKKGEYIKVNINGVDYGYVAPRGYPGGTRGLFKAFKIRMGKTYHGKAFQWLKDNAVPLGKVKQWGTAKGARKRTR